MLSVGIQGWCTGSRMHVRYADTKLHLKVSLEPIFFEMVRTNMKVFILWQEGSARWMFCIHLCRSDLFSVLAAGILWKLNPGLFLREFVQPNAAQVPTMVTLWKVTTGFVPFFKLKFLIPTLRHIFYSPNSSNIHGECDFASSVSGNKLGKCIFVVF